MVQNPFAHCKQLQTIVSHIFCKTLAETNEEKTNAKTQVQHTHLPGHAIAMSCIVFPTQALMFLICSIRS